MIARFFDHLARVGGVFVSPRATLDGVLRSGRGGLFEVMPWMFVVACALQPVRAGQAFLMARVSLLEGFNALARLFAQRMLTPLVAALVAATVLYLFDRLREGAHERITFEGAVDACAFMLFPFLLLCAVGAALDHNGVRLWWTPNRAVVGRGIYLATRIVVAYGWSFVLFGVVLWDLRRRSAEGGAADADGRAE